MFAEPGARESSWVLTQQRFASPRPVSFDEPPRVEAEIAAGRFGHHPRLDRKRVEYDRVAFADGSVIDFVVGPKPKR